MRDIDLLVVGDLNVDIILEGDVNPTFGQVEKIVDNATLALGSSSAIFACGAARLGLRVAFISKVGDDEYGHFLISQLQQRGIETDGVVIDPMIKTGLCVILSRGRDRAMLTYPGSIAAFNYHDINLSFLPRARHLHLGAYFLLDGLKPDVPCLFQLAHHHGLTTSLDTNYDPTGQWDGGLTNLLAQTDIFLPNETELFAITGLSDLELALVAMNEQVDLVAVKLGERGAVARQRWDERLMWADALPMKVVDTTGAGDTFDAGLIYGHLAGWPLSRALQLGCVCGSLSTRGAGGTATQPTLTEALDYL
jgi:sugar/nucleoside kinase (ribokinase family)